MAKGGSKSKSGAALKAFQPFAISGLNNVNSVVGQNAGALQDLTGQVQGLVPGLIEKYNAGDPALNAAENYTTSTLGRDPWAGSSQLDNLINTTNANVRDQVGASYGSRGSFGGTAWESALAKGLAQNEAGLRYGDVQNNQQLQQAAAGMAPQQAAAQYLGITPLLAAAQTGAALPYTGINALSQDYNNLYGSANSSKTSGGGLLGALGGALGGGLSAAGSLGWKPFG